MAEGIGSREPVTGRRRGRSAGSDIAATVIASVAIALPLVFYLHQHVEILRLGYEIESLKDRRVELVERSKELRVKRMQSASLERVEHEAGLMGLVAPDPKSVYIASAPTGARGERTPAREGGAGPRMTARLE